MPRQARRRPARGRVRLALQSSIDESLNRLSIVFMARELMVASQRRRSEEKASSNRDCRTKRDGRVRARFIMCQIAGAPCSPTIDLTVKTIPYLLPPHQYEYEIRASLTSGLPTKVRRAPRRSRRYPTLPAICCGRDHSGDRDIAPLKVRHIDGGTRGRVD